MARKGAITDFALLNLHQTIVQSKVDAKSCKISELTVRCKFYNAYRGLWTAGGWVTPLVFNFEFV